MTLLLCWMVRGFPDGAPIDACVKDRANQPNHGQHRTQPLATLPYRLVASSDTHHPGVRVTGRLTPKLLHPNIFYYD